MSSFKLTIGPRAWVVIATLLVIGLLFGAYFKIYIPRRESDLIKQGFRILGQMADNIQDRNYDFQKLAEKKLFIPDTVKQLALYNNCRDLQQEGLLEELSRLRDSFQSQVNRRTQLERSGKNEYYGISKMDQSTVQAIERSIEHYDDSLRNVERLLHQSNTKINRDLNLLFKQSFTADIEVGIKAAKRLDIINYQETIDSVICQNQPLTARKDTTISLYLRVPISEFMGPILRTDAFDEFFLVRDDSIVYQTIKNKIELGSQHPDSTVLANAMASGNVTTIKSSNQDYRVLVHKMVFENYYNPGFESWYICGMIRDDNYRQEVQQVESFILINAGVVLLFILMGMPMLKLLLMSPIERLYISNVVWVGVSLVFGTSLLTLSFLSAYNYLEVKYDRIDHQLEALGDEVTRAFVNELNENYAMLEHFEDSISGTMLDSLTSKKVAWELFEVDSLVPRVKDKADFNYLFWTDRHGNIRPIFTPFKITGSFDELNISERTYFRDIIDHQVWPLPTADSSDYQKEFALQSIVSWADNTLELGVSKPSLINPAYPVLAVTSKPHSVMDPVLPPGYGFCVLNSQGLALFHSDSGKNLQENFLEETGNRQALSAALVGKIKKHLGVMYLKRWHRIQVNPVGQTPLTVVVFFDLDYLKAPIVQSIIVTMTLIVMLFLLVLLILLILFMYQYRFKKLRIRRFYLNWMNPKSEGKDHYTYQLLFLGNLIVIFFLLLVGMVTDGKHFFWGTSILDQVFLVTVFPLCLLGFNYRVLSGTDSRSLSLVLVTIWGLINLVYFVYFSRPIVAFVQLLLVQGLYMLLLRFLYHTIEKYDEDAPMVKLLQRLTGRDREKDYFNYQRSYLAFLLSWLIISSIIPVLFYYKFAVSTEQQVWQKYAQLRLAQTLEQRDVQLESEFSGRLPESVSQQDNARGFLARKKSAGHYYELLGYNKPDSLAKDLLTPSNLETILFYLRAGFDPLTTETKALVFHEAHQGLWRWGLDENQTLCLRYPKSDGTTIELSKKLDLGALHFFSKKDRWTFGFLLWIPLVVAIVSLYQIIAYSVRKIYAQDYDNIQCDELISLEFLQQREVNRRVFITGLPYSGKWELMRKYQQCLRAQRIPFQVWDCRKLTESSEVYGDPEHSQVVIMDNFEYKINDHQGLKAKLEMLERLLAKRSKQIVISSEVHPQQILIYYQTMINKSRQLQNRQEFREEYQEYRHHYKLWQQIFRGFIKVYQRMETHEVKLHPIYSKTEIGERITAELEPGYFLHRLEPLVHQYYQVLKGPDPKNTKEVNEEDIILKIQSLAESYYHSIWNSFTKSEKYLIFDLAKDRFVNIKNDSAIKNLISKGVFRFKDNLKLMNTSFNNFVLSVVDSDQEMLMERELRKKGKWSIIQVVLILVIISITVFIVLGQKNFLNQFNSLVGAIAAVVGLLLRFGGIFGSGQVGSKGEV